MTAPAGSPHHRATRSPEAVDRPLPAHVTTPLLQLITERSLDEDYALVAAKKQAVGREPQGSRGLLGPAGAAVLAIGALLITISFVQTSRDEDVRALGREALIDQVEAASDEVGRLQGEARELTEEARAGETENENLLERNADVTARLRRLGIRTGYVAVRGDGVRLRVSSAPNADPNDQVRDEDLALLADGLWAAGAEAIAINGIRLVALGGIRNTNLAVHVNGRPLTAPYVVEAIGDQESLQARLLQTSAGLAFFANVNTYEFGYVPQNVDDLRLPAARLRVLRQAKEPSELTEGKQLNEGGEP